MKEAFDISYNQQLPKTVAELPAFFETLFKPATEAHALLIEALKQEEKAKFGSPEIGALRFEIKRFDAETFKGRFRMQYDLQLTFSCSALINDLNNQHSYWNFELDPQTNILRFEGEEYGDIRSTADEF